MKQSNLAKKVSNKLNQWQGKRLAKLNPENYRFRVKVIRETALAYQANIEGEELWLPKSVCEIGIDPTGNYYAIDIKGWYVKKNNLLMWGR
jgi:ABC-type iron transport system FetAB ATPase subunit